MKKIVVCGKYNPEAVDLLKSKCPEGFSLTFMPKQFPQEDFVREVSDADYLFVRGATPVDDDVLSHAKQLKLIMKWGVGFDQYNMEQIGSYNIPFQNNAGVNAVQVSELALTLTLALYRYLPVVIDKNRAGISCKEEYLPLCHTIHDKLVGIVGIGNIGRRVAKLMQGFGATVQYYDAFRLSPEKEAELGVQYVSLDELCRTSDIITLHVPLMEGTVHLIDEKCFSLMKRSTVLINTARGGVVDTKALIAALQEGRLAGAALDVVEAEYEANAPDNPLFQMENVIMTPHIGASTKEVTELQVNMFYDWTLRVDRGEITDKRIFVNGKYLK